MKPHKNELQPLFPEGYEYLQELIAKDLQRSQEIDQQLASWSTTQPKPNAHRISFHPPGMGAGGPSANPDYLKEKLNSEKEQIAFGTTQRVEKEIEMTGADEATAAEIRESLNNQLYPNPFEGKSEQELKRLNNQEKDLQQSQDWMRSRLNQFRTQPGQEKEAIKKEGNSLDNSQEQMQQMLEFTKEKRVNEAAKKGNDPKQISSMSARFSQSLNYTKAIEVSPEVSFSGTPKQDPSPNKTKSDSSPDKD